jgi:membrane protein
VASLNLSRLSQHFNQWLWETDTQSQPWYGSVLLQATRIVYLVFRDISQGQLTLRAMSLVYTTLLSLVPLLALSFSLLKAFGVHNLIQPLLLNLLAPLGDKGAEFAERIVGFVENMGVGVLGSVGLLLLVYTVLSLIQKIEEAFNYIWRVSSLRNLAQRISGYLSTVMIGPLLIVTAIGITATITSATLVQEIIRIEPFGTLYYVVSKFIPYLLVISAFTVIYLIIPNTRVRFSSALVGGIVGGILWETVGWAFASFVAGSAKYEAIYSGFAVVILFLFWVYVSWLVLLTGASIAFYHQNPAYRSPLSSSAHLSHRQQFLAALEVMRLIAAAHRQSTPLQTHASLAEHLVLPSSLLDAIIQSLHQAGLILYTNDEPASLAPGKALASISIKDIFEALEDGNAQNPQVAPQTQELLAKYDVALESQFHSQTLENLFDETDDEQGLKSMTDVKQASID